MTGRKKIIYKSTMTIIHVGYGAENRLAAVEMTLAWRRWGGITRLMGDFFFLDIQNDTEQSCLFCSNFILMPRLFFEFFLPLFSRPIVLPGYTQADGRLGRIGSSVRAPVDNPFSTATNLFFPALLIMSPTRRNSSVNNKRILYSGSGQKKPREKITA